MEETSGNAAVEREEAGTPRPEAAETAAETSGAAGGGAESTAEWEPSGAVEAGTGTDGDGLEAWREPVLLPEGWKEGDDIFSLKPLEESGEREAPQNTDETRKPEEAAPVSAEGTETAEGTEGTGAAKTDAEPSQTEKPGNVPEPDYKALYENLVRQERDARDQARFRETYQRQIDGGMTEEVALMAARDAAGGRTFPLSDDGADGAGQGAAPAGENAAPPDMAASVRQLRTLYPDAESIPAEVARQVQDGGDLLSAYAAYRTGEDARTIAALREENQRLRRQRENTVRAPVRGVSGGAPRRDEETDDFLKGFYRDPW